MKPADSLRKRIKQADSRKETGDAMQEAVMPLTDDALEQVVGGIDLHLEEFANVKGLVTSENNQVSRIYL